MAKRLAMVAEHRSEVVGREALSSSSARLASHSHQASQSHRVGVGVSMAHASGALPGLGTPKSSRVGTETGHSRRPEPSGRPKPSGWGWGVYGPCQGAFSPSQGQNSA